MISLKQRTGAAAGAFYAASHAIEAGRDLAALFREIPRHNSFRYISSKTLPDAYFAAAKAALSDPYLYLVLSDTKTPAGKIIASLTHDPYNHVSLSLDRNLETMVSYNGGNGRGSPGLNREVIHDICGRPGAKMAVFRMYAGTGKKALILDRIRQINDEGSSYNRLGLVLKRSLKPNIMFCSQFVNSMLELANLDYLGKNSGNVKPVDFIAGDADGRLTWVYGEFRCFFDSILDSRSRTIYTTI
jgi:hypothetical protein